MQSMATLCLSCAALLSSSGLAAQSSYFSDPGNSPYISDKPSPSPSRRIHWLSHYSEAVALSQSTSKPILVLFTGTSWCPACIKLEREVLQHPEFAQAVSQRFIFLKAEFPDYSEAAVIASPFKPLLDRYRIDAFPTIIVINANGQELYTVNYREGGPHVYARELLQKLHQTNSNNP